MHPLDQYQVQVHHYNKDPHFVLMRFAPSVTSDSEEKRRAVVDFVQRYRIDRVILDFRAYDPASVGIDGALIAKRIENLGVNYRWVGESDPAGTMLAPPSVMIKQRSF